MTCVEKLFLFLNLVLLGYVIYLQLKISYLEIDIKYLKREAEYISKKQSKLERSMFELKTENNIVTLPGKVPNIKTPPRPRARLPL